MKNKKRYILLTTISAIIFTTIFTYFSIFKPYNGYSVENVNKTNKITKSISMNLEQTAGAGDYKTVTQSRWPTSGYKFNSELSKCENGSTLNWDDENKTIIFSGNVTDKCYAYFDAKSIPDVCSDGITLANCIKNYGNEGSNISNIYIHNSDLTNGAGDNSYRFAGANPTNYVCFGSTVSPCPEDNLYRIIGGIDDKIKLVKNIPKYNNSYIVDCWSSSYSSTNIWSSGSLYSTLNTSFVSYLGDWSNKITTTAWTIGGNFSSKLSLNDAATLYQNEIVTPFDSSTVTSKVALMYGSDYLFTKINNSTWIKTVGGEWLLTPVYNNAGELRYALSGANGSVYAIAYNDTVNCKQTLARPTFFLNSEVTYKSGAGTLSDVIYIN